MLVRSNGVAQTFDRPLGPFLNNAVAAFCSAGDLPGDCRLPANSYDDGDYTRTTTSNMVLTQRPLTSHAFRPDLIPPAAPEELEFLGGGPGEIRLLWLPATEYDLQGFRVYRGESEVGPFTLITQNLLTVPRFVDTGLPAGRIFYYKVAAVDFSGLESDFNPTLFAAAYPRPPQPRLTARYLPERAMRFTVYGGLGWRYRLEYSFNLEEWFPAADVSAGLDGQTDSFDDYIPKQYPYAFWRAILPT